MKYLLIFLCFFLVSCNKVNDNTLSRASTEAIINEFNDVYNLEYQIEEIKCMPANSNSKWMQFYDPKYPGFPISFLYNYELSISDNLDNQQLITDIKTNQERIYLSEELNDYFTALFKQEVIVYVNGIRQIDGFSLEDPQTLKIGDIFIATEFTNDLSFYQEIINQLDFFTSENHKTNVILYLLENLNDINYEISLCSISYSSFTDEYGVCGYPFSPREDIQYLFKVTNYDN